VCKVFLSVPMGIDGHVETGIIWKLDLQNLRFLLGSYKIHLRDIQDGWPIAQLPFLAYGFLQPIGRLESSTHFGVLPESGTKHKPLKQKLWRNSKEPCRLNGGLKKKFKVQKVLVPKKLLLVPIPHVRPVGWPGTEKVWPAKWTA
jgi:hypothetical protein